MSKLSSTRLVDEHATNIASGFRRPDLGATNRIAPIVSVTKESGKFYEFAADASVVRGNITRALGDERKRIDVSVGSGSYSTDETSLEIPLYDRVMRNVPDSRKQKFRDNATLTVTGYHQLALEYTVAQLLKDPAQYDAACTVAVAGVDQWKETTSNPYKATRAWLRTMAAILGVPQEQLGVAFAPKPWQALGDHAKTDTKLAPTGKDVSPQVVANILSCREVTLLNGMYASTFDKTDTKATRFSFIFDDEVIVYLPIDDPGVGDPLWFACPRIEGMPLVTEYRDEPRSADIIACDDNTGIVKQSDVRGFLATSVSGL